MEINISYWIVMRNPSQKEEQIIALSYDFNDAILIQKKEGGRVIFCCNGKIQPYFLLVENVNSPDKKILGFNPTMEGAEARAAYNENISIVSVSKTGYFSLPEKVAS